MREASFQNSYDEDNSIVSATGNETEYEQPTKKSSLVGVSDILEYLKNALKPKNDDKAVSYPENGRIPVKHEDSVPFELLFAFLNDKGKVTSDDFLGQARLALQTSNVEDYDQASKR